VTITGQAEAYDRHTGRYGPELGSFVTGLNCVLARLRDAVPTRAADTGNPASSAT
jgi:hypothetical protein